MMSGGDGQPETLGGVTVTLGGEHAMGESAETDMNGGFAFTGLRAGTYTVTISGFPEDVSFETVSMDVEVEVGDVGNADFTGHFIRTSAVAGQVIIEGEGLAAVTVTLSGGPADESYTTMTDAEGMYSFAELRPGDYTVSISNPDSRDYEFASTSQDVSVNLDETGTVSFTGVLLRTSGIAGRVSVEGMGLGDITVTLSGADDRTAMTDASGQYAFAGLAAGDYMVSIMVESNAYVFSESETSKSVTVADDESKIVNFDGDHDTSASVSGMLYVDEATKNDMHDDGEDGFPSAAVLQALRAAGVQLPPVLPVPITLHGPGVNQMQSGSLNLATGQFSFGMLRAGSYELRVGSLASALSALPAEAAAVLRDFEYGGPAAGYPLTVGVGEAVTQNVPVDITHTTVHFAVTLKAGDNRGMPVPGASVTLTSGESTVGSGMTGDTGLAMIRFARAGTSGNMVSASVKIDGYHVADGMTTVAWDPKSPHTQAMNSNDIVNLNVDITFGGATITTEYGGGDALKGWALSVTMGEGDDAEAVEGDHVPEMLDDMGMASFKTMVESVPAMYTFAVADDQDDKMDGGENYESDAVEYTHDGLSLMGAMDAGMIEVAYTTQTLKVYVHHERDQVEGFTGSILGGDYRVSGIIDVGIRHIADNGRSRAFASDVWKKTSSTFSDSKGVVTFRGVPADANVIVTADEVAQDPEADGYQPVMLLDPDELAAYTGEDYVMGGAFGDMGGFSHSVSLCPLQATDPTDQDHGECGSFAFVETYAVHGQAWKNDVIMNRSDDGFTTRGLRAVPGTTVDLDPVPGKNLAGESESFTALEKPVRTRGEDVAGTSILDETKEFNFGRMAAGVYKVTVPDGWVAKVGAPGAATALGNAFNPLMADQQVDVTPTTGILYGRVTGAKGFPLDSTTVTVNGMSTETDKAGRYIVDGFAHRTGANTTATNPDWRKQRIVVVTASRGGFDVAADTMLFAGTVNNPTEHNIRLAGTAATATVSGTVTAFGSTTPISGVQILVNGVPPINKNAKSVRSLPANDIYVTDADGNYTIRVPATGAGQTSRISALRAGMTFSPAHLDLSTPKGSSVSGINFQGVANSSITGRVKNPTDDGPMAGVVVTATASGATKATDEAITGVTGTFSLSVPAGIYDVRARKDGYKFTCPGTPESCSVRVGLGQTVSFGDFQGRVNEAIATLSALSLSVGTLDPAFKSDVTMYTADVANDVEQITVTATPTDGNATVEIRPADADMATAGHQVALAVGGTEITAKVIAADGTTTETYIVRVTRANTHPTVTLVLKPDEIAEGDGQDPSGNPGSSTVTATVSPMADKAFTVTVSIDDDTWATLSDDVELTFAANAAASTGTVTITAVNDDIYTGDRTVTVSGASSDAAVAAHPTDVTLTIEEDEAGSAPGAVQNLDAEAGDQQVKLTWGRPLSTGSDPITGYKWTATATGRLPLRGEVGASAREYTVTGLDNGVEYTFSVLAVSAAGDGVAFGTPTSVSPMPTITLTLSGTSIEEGETESPITATVKLSNPSTVEVTVAVAEVVDGTARLTVEAGEVVIAIGQTTPAAGTDDITITAQGNDTDDGDAAAMVRATSPNASSSDSDPAKDGEQPHEITIEDDDRAPGAPRSLTLTAGNASISAEWISPVDIGTAASITNYQYRAYKTGDGAPAANENQGWANATSPQSITQDVAGATLENDTEYTVEVRAVSAAGNGEIASEKATPSAG